MGALFLLASLLMAVHRADCNFWPFGEFHWGNPFAAATQPSSYEPPSYWQPSYEYQHQYPYHYPHQQPYQQQQYSSPCSRGRKRRQVVVDANLADLLNPVCKSKQLNNLMIKNMSNKVAESTRAIQRAAKKLGDFDVICVKGEFAYTMKSNLFCQAQVDDLICYAFSSQY